MSLLKGEQFFLQLLLTIFEDGKSWEHLRTWNGQVFDIFKKACMARGLLKNKVFIQASGLACEVYVEVSPLRSLPTTVCETANSVVCQVAMLPSFNSL